MKKTYQHPTTIVVKVHPVLLNSASPGYGGTTNATSGNLSRRGDDSFWDDEEDY